MEVNIKYNKTRFLYVFFITSSIVNFKLVFFCWVYITLIYTTLFFFFEQRSTLPFDAMMPLYY